MINYFIKKKSGDNEGNKDYKNLNSKAFGLFKHGRVQSIEVVIGESGQVIYIRCECLPEIKKNLKYKLNITMINTGEQAGEITYACCSPCPPGKGPFASCKHLAALCFALAELVRLKQSRDFATCTERLHLEPTSETKIGTKICVSNRLQQKDLWKRVQGTGRFFMTLDCLYTETLRTQTKTCSIISGRLT